jgi:hypothetical protein
MAQDSERFAHDEKTDAKAVTLHDIKAGKSLEYLRKLFIRDPYPGVVHIDPDSRIGVSATNKDATSRLGVFDRIADQIAQSGAEQDAFAQYQGVAGNHVNAYSFAQRCMFVVPARLP